MNAEQIGRTVRWIRPQLPLLADLTDPEEVSFAPCSLRPVAELGLRVEVEAGAAANLYCGAVRALVEGRAVSGDGGVHGSGAAVGVEANLNDFNIGETVWVSDDYSSSLLVKHISGEAVDGIRPVAAEVHRVPCEPSGAGVEHLPAVYTPVVLVAARGAGQELSLNTLRRHRGSQRCCGYWCGRRCCCCCCWCCRRCCCWRGWCPLGGFFLLVGSVVPGFSGLLWNRSRSNRRSWSTTPWSCWSSSQ